MKNIFNINLIQIMNLLKIFVYFLLVEIQHLKDL